MDSETLLIGKPYFFKLFHCFFNIVNYLQVKKAKKDLVDVEGKNPMTEEDVGHGGVTIKSSEECRPHKEILEKPSVEMKRNIKPLYVRANLNRY